MKVYIDGLHLIRIESNVYIYQIEIDHLKLNWLKNEGFNQFFVSEHPIELHRHEAILINGSFYPLEIGIVTLSKEFEQRFRYDGPLGYVYSKEETRFYLFSPVAKEVFLVCENEEFLMTYQEPVWSVSIKKDLEGSSYHYKIRLLHAFENVLDPYTLASSTTKSYVIDFDKLEPIHQTPIKLKRYVDAVIYEGHVRDMTIALDVEPKGLFDSLSLHSETLKGSVLSYIKKLGMTHLQLLPVYDFEGVDDIHKDKLYNWGYNPSQYFSIEGWYSENPDDPYDRINAFRRLVNNAHALKLGVNMDVVYNHVYQYRTFPYDKIVPGYFYRHDHKKKMTDASYCGNDVETRNYMVRRLIVDSLVHFAKNYQIDGFRFDLMGLLDIETMKLIDQKLRGINPYMMLYGEGWNMISEVPSKSRSNLSNNSQFTEYAHFNDFYRNTLKGELHGPGIGFAMGNKHLIQKAMDALIGSPHIFSSPSQSINYVECHDNTTFYDKMLLTCGFENPEFKLYQELANHMIAISQGIPFYHAGQEFYRTKMGVENSYNSPDEINKIVWKPKDVAVIKLKKLLQIRKKYSLYRQTSYNTSVSITREGNMIVYQLEDQHQILIHYIKNYQGIERLSLNEGKLIFPSQKVLAEESSIYVDQPGIYIVHFKK